MADPFQMGQTPQTNFQIPQGASLPAMPVGAMAGGMQVQNQQRMEQFAEMQKKANLMSLAQQLMQAQEYQQNQAWRDAERGAGIEKANVTKDFSRREASARVGTAEAEAKLKSGTLESDIAAGKAKNETTVSEAQMKKMENFVEDLNVNSQNWDPMTASVEFDKMAESHGIPKDHPIRARMAAAKSPQEFQMMLKGMSEKMVSSIAQQRSIQMEKMKEDSAYKRSVDVAKIGANATITAAGLRNKHDASMTPPKQLAAAREVVNRIDPKKDPSAYTQDEQSAMYTLDDHYGTAETKLKSEADKGLKDMLIIAPQMYQAEKGAVDAKVAAQIQTRRGSYPPAYRAWKDRTDPVSATPSKAGRPSLDSFNR